MTILVVDDAETNRRLLRAIFSTEGYRVLEAGDGLEALQILGREQIDVIVSDILMPNMDGYRLCAEVRRDARFRNLPFVFYTSTFASSSDEKLALEVGADRFIRKPISASVLLAIVRELMDAPPPNRGEVFSPPGLDVTKEYAQQLVTKLEEKNKALLQRTDELRETFEKLHAVIDAAPVATIALDCECRVKMWNPAAERIFGWSESEAIGRIPPYLNSDEDRECRAISARAFAGETITGMEVRRRRRDGTLVDVNLSIAPLRDVEGKVVGAMVMLEDITERKLAEEVLQRREAQLEEAQALAGLGSWDWDIPQDKLHWSDEIYSIFGVTPEEFSANEQAFLKCVHPDDRKQIEAGIADALAGSRPYDYEIRVVRPDGSVRIVHSRGRVVYDETGKPIRMFGMAQDITERKQVEAELENARVRSEMLSRRLLETRESELRMIARELHDEIGQSLTAAKLEIEAAKRSTDPASLALRLDDAAAVIEHLLQRVRELSLDLRPPLLDELGLVPALRAHVNQQAERAGLSVRFVTDELCERLDSAIEISCFRVAQEALTNTIRHAQAKAIEIELHCPEGELRLIIHDDGVGLDVVAATARAERGQSFGLLSMRERVELVGGRFECKSAPGEGTTIQAIFKLGIFATQAGETT